MQFVCWVFCASSPNAVSTCKTILVHLGNVTTIETCTAPTKGKEANFAEIGCTKQYSNHVSIKKRGKIIYSVNEISFILVIISNGLRNCKLLWVLPWSQDIFLPEFRECRCLRKCGPKWNLTLKKSKISLTDMWRDIIGHRFGPKTFYMLRLTFWHDYRPLPHKKTTAN